MEGEQGDDDGRLIALGISEGQQGDKGMGKQKPMGISERFGDEKF